MSCTYKYTVQCLNESVVIAKMSQIADEELKEKMLVHAIEEPESTAEVTGDQSYVALEEVKCRCGTPHSSRRGSICVQ